MPFPPELHLARRKPTVVIDPVAAELVNSISARVTALRRGRDADQDASVDLTHSPQPRVLFRSCRLVSALPRVLAADLLELPLQDGESRIQDSVCDLRR